VAHEKPQSVLANAFSQIMSRRKLGCDTPLRLCLPSNAGRRRRWLSARFTGLIGFIDDGRQRWRNGGA
jgi:hypothetical protein